MSAEYLVFANLTSAHARTKGAWEQVLGRPAHGSDTTQYLWGHHKHPEDNRVALHISSHMEFLSPQEVNALVTKEYLDAEGFFPPPLHHPTN